MSFILKYFTIDITPGALPPVVHVSEYDTGRQYGVTITDGNGPFSIPLGATATVEGTLNGTIGFTTSATIANGNVMFTLTESMTAQSGRAWVKIKIVKDGEPVSTAAFILAVDRAGVEAETVIGAEGFYDQIAAAVDAWLEQYAPNGIPDAVKQALLACFQNVAWTTEDGQDYYDALYDALYPPVNVLSISAVFTQGDAVIYDTDELDTLKQYLVVTATMTDSTTQTLEDADYTLSGTLTEGTSTITVSYGGKTTTFNVTVSSVLLPAGYQQVEWIQSNGSQLIDTGVTFEDAQQAQYEMEAEIAIPQANASTAVLFSTSAEGGCYLVNVLSGTAVGLGSATTFSNLDISEKHTYVLSWDSANGIATCEGQSVMRTKNAQEAAKPCFFGDYEKLYLSKCRMYRAKVRHNGNNIRDLVPCYRTSDSAIGMYDIVNSTFYTNSGTGSFTKGSDV